MTEHETNEPTAEVIDLAAERRRRRLGLKAVETAETRPFPLFVDVKLSEADDAATLRAWIMADSPTAYYDALAYGQSNEATVLWGRVRSRQAEVKSTDSSKLAIIFEHDAVPDYAAMQRAMQAVADLTGPDRRFDIAEHYHQASWRNVTLPAQPVLPMVGYELAA